MPTFHWIGKDKVINHHMVVQTYAIAHRIELLTKSI